MDWKEKLDKVSWNERIGERNVLLTLVVHSLLQELGLLQVTYRSDLHH